MNANEPSTMETARAAAVRIGAALNGDQTLFERSFSGVSTDSRSVAPGELFVALSGPNFDGHAFVPKAVERGAAAALVSRAQDLPLPQLPLPQLLVPDTLAALQAYAASWRAEFSLPLIGVTGSNGKTTVKQMLAAVLAPLGPVLATAGNYNNHIGVPLTLCRLRAEHRAAVIEMGANHRGEIAQLADIARPNIGVVTQAGDAHLEGFGSREGVARSKGELFAALADEAVAIINADDVQAPLWLELAGGSRVIRFGLSADADVRAEDIQGLPAEAPAEMHFTIHAFGARAAVRLPLPGRHNVLNALAATAAALAAGLELDQIAQGLAQVQPAGGRLSWKAGRHGTRVLDDSYNANPTSLQAALQVLAQCAPPRWVVLGDMAELGQDADELHVEAGFAARSLGVERLYSVGRYARSASVGFGRGGRDFADVDALARTLQDEIEPGVSVLVKGSRSARMERVVAALTGSVVGGGH